MKIVIKGQKPDIQMFEGKCHSCNSVMQEKRCKLKVESDMRDWQEFAHARCPVCGSDFVMIPLKGEAKEDKP